MFAEDSPIRGELIVGCLRITSPHSSLLPPHSDDNRQTLSIDARGTFGAGTHPTTRLLLRRIVDCAAPASSALDVGTGSGILALAAACLGCQAVGVDIDPAAIVRADENRRRNHIADELIASQHDHTALQHDLDGTARFFVGGPAALAETFDLVVANLFPSALAGALAAISERLRPAGVLLISGVLLVDVDRVQRLLEEAGFVLETRAALEGWALLTCRLAPRPTKLALPG